MSGREEKQNAWVPCVHFEREFSTTCAGLVNANMEQSASTPCLWWMKGRGKAHDGL